jgi:hypothetical protein
MQMNDKIITNELDLRLDMTLQKCHKCDKLIEDNFYCDNFETVRSILAYPKIEMYSV